MMGVQPLSRETRLLLLSAGGQQTTEPLQFLCRQEIDWDLVLALAEREKAGVILWRRLSALGESLLPDSVCDRLRRKAMVAEFRQLYLQQRLHEVLAILDDARMPVLLLKGAALVQTAYESFAERPMGDLDILLDVGHSRPAHAMMLARGWKEDRVGRPEDYDGHHHLLPLVDPKGTNVRLEIHTELFMPGHPFGLTSSLLREHAQAVSVDGRTVQVPAISHQMIHLCLHLSWSHVLRHGAWRAFRDVNALIAMPRFDWDAFIAAAVECRASTCCYWTLRLAALLTHLAVPQTVLSALQPPLPAGVLNRLERHFLACLLPSEFCCPSARLGQSMWELAIRPGWSGHGKSRPWSRWDASRAFTLPKTPAEQHSLRTRVRKLAALPGYLRVVLP